MSKVNLRALCASIKTLFVFALFSIMTTSVSSQCSLICNHNLQVSLGPDCTAIITPGMMLNDTMTSCPSGNFLIQVFDEYNNLIPTSPEVTGYYVNETLTVKVIETNSGNTCWGNILVEDKLPPVIDECLSSDDMSCAEFAGFTGPIFRDACEGIVPAILVGEDIVSSNCPSPYIKEITRIYTAKDSKGRYAPQCTITYNLTRIEFDSIICPSSYVRYQQTASDRPALDCSGMPWDSVTVNGYPDVEEFPVPSYATTMGDTIPLFPLPDFYCNIGITYSDIELPTVNCSKKIMRTWEIREWYCGQEYRKTCLQIFEIVDTQAPVVSCSDDIIVSTNTTMYPTETHYGVVTCGSQVSIPLPEATDNCTATEDLVYDIDFPGGFVNNYTGQYIELPMGANEVTFIVKDGCYNSDTCKLVVNVVDATPPVAICDEFSVVSLTSNGEAHVGPETFDDGSYDDCKLLKRLVRRMDPVCGCDYPHYDDMHYLGEFNNHHYYVSHDELPAFMVNPLAKSMGGIALKIETLEENKYVYDALTEHFDHTAYPHANRKVWIGLDDYQNEGNFRWSDGSILSYDDYKNWAPGQPNGSGDYVAMGTSGTWDDYDGSHKLKYIFEVDDPCTWSSYVEFCCDDVGNSEVVGLRIVDVFGNYNECMVNIEVQDKLAPNIYCPNDTTVTCDFIYDENNLGGSFGTANAADNCNASMSETHFNHLNQCNIGYIKRRFYAQDNFGRVDSCDQVIHFINNDRFDEYDIIWPADSTATGCLNVDDYSPEIIGYPTFLGDQCDLVGANHEDDVFLFNHSDDESCFKIIRRWTVIDWCQYEELGDDAKWHHIQVIKGVNNVGPTVVSGPDTIKICTYDADCLSGTFSDGLQAVGEDNCTMDDYLEYTIEIDLHANNTIDSLVQGDGAIAEANDTYPIGTHIAKFSFSDRCGNTTTRTKVFIVQNCKSPTPYCIAGLSVDLMPINQDSDPEPEWGMIELWASDFDKGSFHPCPGYDVILSFSSDPEETNRTFDCNDVIGSNDDGTVPVEIWVTVVDQHGEPLWIEEDSLLQAYCVTYVDIQDNMLVCPDAGTGNTNGGSTGGNTEIAQANISGRISMADGRELTSVEVNISGDTQEQELTNETGEYAFNPMNIGGEYTLTPKKVDDYLNGVSTLDAVMIQRHILGLADFTESAQYVAADVSKDANVSSIDLLEIRKLVLGLHTEFPNNDSWRFVDQNFDINTVDNPLLVTLPEDYEIDVLSNDMNIDFYGIKVGDVNNTVILDAQSNDIETRNRNTVELYPNNLTLDKGNGSVELYLKDMRNTYGFQFTLQMPEGVAINGINSTQIDLNDSNVNMTFADQGLISISWNSPEPTQIDNDNSIFTIDYTARNYAKVTGNLLIHSGITQAEFYNDDMTIETPVINVLAGDLINEFALFQNQPNPFNGSTNIRFVLPQSGMATLNITDVNGKLVKVVKGQFDKGMNSIEVEAEEFSTEGILYYTLDTEFNTATKKMVIIR